MATMITARTINETPRLQIGVPHRPKSGPFEHRFTTRPFPDWKVRRLPVRPVRRFVERGNPPLRGPVDGQSASVMPVAIRERRAMIRRPRYNKVAGELDDRWLALWLQRV